MPIVQSIDHALAQSSGGISRNSLDAALTRTEVALDWLLARHADGALPLLRLPERRDDLDAVIAAAKGLGVDATDIVFLGTGGSSLGGQTLAQLSGHAVPGLGLLRDGPRLHFLDNLDPQTFAQVLAAGYLTRVVGIHRRGREWYEGTFLPRIGPITLYGLLFTIVLLFALQGHQITGHPLDVVRIALPLLAYFAAMFAIAFGWGITARYGYPRTATLALTAASNNFELAIAVAIGVFGATSGEALPASSVR